MPTDIQESGWSTTEAGILKGVVAAVVAEDISQHFKVTVKAAYRVHLAYLAKPSTVEVCPPASRLMPQSISSRTSVPGLHVRLLVPRARSEGLGASGSCTL